MNSADRLKLHNLEVTAITMMGEHGLLRQGWFFKWDRAKNRLGSTQQRRVGGVVTERYITLSAPHALIQDHATMLDVIKHELAHAIAGHAAGHGPAWKRACALTGAKPERCKAVEVHVPAKYVGVCKRCGVSQGKRHRYTAATMADDSKRFSYCVPCKRAGATYAEARLYWGEA